MSLHVVVLAAGNGKRMLSGLPKVLHRLAGATLIDHVLNCAQQLSPTQIHVIVGHQAPVVIAALASRNVHFVEQKEQLGTGHAVLQVLPFIPDDAQVLILSADVPLLQLATLQALSQSSVDSLSLLTAVMSDPTGLGRIIRDNQGRMTSIVEEKDANATQKAINEINAGVYYCPAKLLKAALPTASNQNAQQEYYLTDIVTYALQHGVAINPVLVANAMEVHGINHRGQLAIAEREIQRRQAWQLMVDCGVTMRDPGRVDIRGQVKAGRDVVIDCNVILEGDVELGERCVIGPNCYLRDVRIGDDVIIKANCVIEEAQIASSCELGPYARVRPGTVLATHVKVGNFVEIKKSQVGESSKIPHLSYVGDAIVGSEVNVGAGTITCNYDGITKHQTVIEDGVFIGSDTQLIAPVRLGAGGTIAAGTTVTKDTPANALTLSRIEQKSIAGWQRKSKAKE